jgi:glutaredoxin
MPPVQQQEAQLKMKRVRPTRLILCAVFAAAAALPACAQPLLYKWTGADGKVNYTDKPPPASAMRTEAKPFPGAAAGGSELPFELAEAARNHPVTLYTTANCPACDEGRKLLSERGIPFGERTVNSNEDIVQLRKISGDRQLPLLLVGRSRQLGFEPSNWNTALSAAGYPETSRLPRNHVQPPAEALAGAPAAGAPAATLPKNSIGAAGSAAAGGAANRNDATALPPAVGNAPPGFRF